MKTILARLKEETPWFFVKVKALCVMLVIVSTSAYQCTDLPVIIYKLLPFTITIGCSAFFVAQLAVKYPERLPKDPEPNQEEN